MISSGRILSLTVRGRSPGYFFKELVDTAQATIDRYWNYLKYRVYVPCLTKNCPADLEVQRLRDFCKEGITSLTCDRCLVRQNISSLLVGFAPSQAEVQKDVVTSEMASDVAVIRSTVETLAERTGYVLDEVRSTLKVVKKEVSDCPRLFVLVETQKRGVRHVQFWQVRYRMTLWCEHPGNEHPWHQAIYSFTRPQGFILEIAPYLSVVLKTLRLVFPVLGPIADLTLSQAERTGSRRR